MAVCVRAGQLVTVGLHDVMVMVEVMVDISVVVLVGSSAKTSAAAVRRTAAEKRILHGCFGSWLESGKMERDSNTLVV